VVKVCEYIIALDFIETWYVILSFAPYTIALEDSDIEVTAKSEGIEILAGQDNATCACKGVIDEISF
jgi:hypothetical protein